MHLDRGFTLLDSGLGPASKALWTFPFDKLKGSADDGNKLLYLDFSGTEDGAELVSRSQWSPRPNNHQRIAAMVPRTKDV